jgi:hypothetical protein
MSTTPMTRARGPDHPAEPTPAHGGDASNGTTRAGNQSSSLDRRPTLPGPGQRHRVGDPRHPGCP